MCENFLKKICSIKKIDGKWILYDCNDIERDLPSEDSYFSRTIKTEYLKHRKVRKDIETVWTLVGIDKDNKNYVQVGRSKCIINSLNEIREDIKEFIRGEGNYGKLKKKDYEELVFYEIDTEEYLKNDSIFNYNFKILSKNNDFELVYYHIAAAYVEGKFGYESKAHMYHPSTLDGYFYEFYKV